MSHSNAARPAHPLQPFGWNPAHEENFGPHSGAGLAPGRVARVDGAWCDVVAADPATGTARLIRATAPPSRDRDPARSPCTGDWAAIDLTAGPPRIAALLPRATAIIRGSADGRSQGQVLAANVDIVLITVSLAAKPDLGRVERCLALAWESGARPVVLMTKADVDYDPAVVRDAGAAAPGATVLVVSALTGEGMDALAACLKGGTAALIGASGTGKSTLANALAGVPVMAVGATRRRDGKGRHTTSSRELILIPGGVLIDTPGLRGVGVYDARAGIAETFADIEALARECRFGDCAHQGEPGCAVAAAVAGGVLTARRLASYHKLQRENEWIASRSDARLAAERRRRWKAKMRQAGPARP